ncbi:MAG: hypothetical protein H7145_17340 [Akkermansiaceae bacterium]|nr:hypothetical protein [Armatimonadota bacterium]
MTAYPCTLFEGTYHVGVGALFNSLHQNGFRGTLLVGYRGALPPWATPVTTTDDVTEYDVPGGGRIRFILLETTSHLANYKPIFMRQLFERFLGPGDSLLYFDPDITVKCRWSFFEEWVENGLAMVEDCTFPHMPGDHPLRYSWMKVAEAAGLTQKRSPNRYYNSGFVGLPWRFRDVASVWELLLHTAQSFGYDNSKLATTDRTMIWQATDQDLLNIVAMTTDVPLTTLGPDGMDFVPGGYVMSHAVNSPKPWGRSYLKVALQGRPPGIPDKSFWANSQHPIRLYPAAYVRQRTLAMMIAIALGRVYRRP